MFDVTYKYILVGYGAAGGGDRMYCPEGGCGRGFIGSDGAAGSDFEKGFMMVQGANPPSAVGGIDFDSRMDAENWLKSPDGQKFLEQFMNVLMIRSIR